METKNNFDTIEENPNDDNKIQSDVENENANTNQFKFDSKNNEKNNRKSLDSTIFRELNSDNIFFNNFKKFVYSYYFAFSCCGWAKSFYTSSSKKKKRNSLFSAFSFKKCFKTF